MLSKNRLMHLSAVADLKSVQHKAQHSTVTARELGN